MTKAYKAHGNKNLLKKMPFNSYSRRKKIGDSDAKHFIRFDSKYQICKIVIMNSQLTKYPQYKEQAKFYRQITKLSRNLGMNVEFLMDF